MADIDGLIGYNSPSGINKLLAAYGNDIIDVLTGLGYGLNISSGNKAFFEVFIDRIFFTNGVDKMRSGNGTSWSDSIGLPKQIIPKYIHKSVNNAQLFIGNCILTPGSGTALNYKSYVFYSDFPRLAKSPTGSAITQNIEWGIESGRCNINQLTRKLKAVPDGNGRLPYFKARGIKVGDPVFLLGGDIGQYTVAAVESEYELVLNETIPSLDAVNTNIDFWVGNNFFAVGTDDNDEITGFGENSSNDLIFKKFSVWFYNGTQLKQLKGAVGTTSTRSIINDRKGNTYYFHGSDEGKTGLYRIDSNGVTKISRGLDPFFLGMDSANYTEVVAWEEGDDLRFFIGDLTNANDDISMTNAVVTINTATGALDVGPIGDALTCATQYIVSNAQNAYCGTSEAKILKMHSGNSFNGTPISARVETGPRYPRKSHIINSFPYVQVVGKNVKGIRMQYRLWNAPLDEGGRWIPLGELDHDLNEFILTPDKRSASGIEFSVEDNGILENDWLIEEITCLHKAERSRLL